MLISNYLDEVINCCLALLIFLWAIAFTAYRVNSRRAANDPKKRTYHPLAILVAPFLFLLFLPLAISVFLLAVALYGVFLILFTILLVALRKPFLFIWWNKFATFVGEPLLKLGTTLIMIPVKLLTPSPRPRPQQAMG